MSYSIKLAIIVPEESNEQTTISLIDIVKEVNHVIVDHLSKSENLLCLLPSRELLTIVTSNVLVNLLNVSLVDVLIPEDRLRILRSTLSTIEKMSFELWSTFEANTVGRDVCN